MESTFYLLIPLFFLAAVLYSSAGLGGGSTYLALLSLFGFSHLDIPLFALSCNILVVIGGFWHFWRAGHFRFTLLFSFLITSIPFSYLGGRLFLDKKTFSILLSLSLAFAAFRLFFESKEGKLQSVSRKRSFMLGLPLGAAIGFLSGLLGIGGGIFLSPLLLLLRWADSKQTAAAASLFILINSLAGLMGQFSKGQTFRYSGLLLLLLGAVFLGSQIGARWGALRSSTLLLQRITAGILSVASARIWIGL